MICKRKDKFSPCRLNKLVALLDRNSNWHGSTLFQAKMSFIVLNKYRFHFC